MAATNGNRPKSGRNVFTLSDGLTDNIALIEWVEQSRRVLHAGALELGITASELEAKLRRASRGLVVGGLSARYRAHMVTKPVQQASEALVIASQYIVTAGNRFEAAFGYELEQAGYKGRGHGADFKFKGQ